MKKIILLFVTLLPLSYPSLGMQGSWFSQYFLGAGKVVTKEELERKIESIKFMLDQLEKIKKSCQMRMDINHSQESVDRAHSEFNAANEKIPPLQIELCQLERKLRDETEKASNDDYTPSTPPKSEQNDDMKSLIDKSPTGIRLRQTYKQSGE